MAKTSKNNGNKKKVSKPQAKKTNGPKKKNSKPQTTKKTGNKEKKSKVNIEKTVNKPEKEVVAVKYATFEEKFYHKLGDISHIDRDTKKGNFIYAWIDWNLRKERIISIGELEAMFDNYPDHLPIS